jgi:NAD(P)-dependent dehydrogenase (short-subunit alcohol dehydrogenase family)
LDRKSIVVTGTSSGIGAATALLLERSGFRVFAGVRQAADGERLRASSAGNVLPLLLDVTDARSIRSALDEVNARLGGEGLAGLVNNAGVFLMLPFELTPVETFREVFEVNVVGTMAVTQALLPLLRQGRGRVVNIGSSAGRASSPGSGAYSGSKHALEALTVAMRAELEQFGIQVSLVGPGNIRTPIWDKALATATNVSRGVPPEVRALYTRLLDKMQRMNRAMAEAGIPAEDVARVVLRALTEKRARTRYSIGFEAHLLDMLRFAPDRLRELLIRKQFGL